ncbi:MAG: OmpA family protein [Bacteroidota bacterium]
MKYGFKNWKSVCTIGAFSLTTMFSFAQDSENLLSNGGFESNDGKVKKLGAIESATTWTSPTGVRADLFTSGKVPDIGTPLNVYGKEDAKDGKSYAGIVAYSYGNKVPRSYLMAKLDTPLKKGMKYCVSFHVSLAEASKYAIHNVGAMLTKKDFATDAKTPLIEDKVNIKHFNDQKMFNATFNWEKVCGVFEAEGGEKFITIGNFTKDDKVKQEANKPNKKDKDLKVTQIIAAYYYIDEVSVSLISENSQCDCMLSENENEYSTTIYQKKVELNDKMTDQQKVELQQLYFAFGKTAFTSEANASLDLIAEILKANPNQKLEIIGNSDKIEDELAVEKAIYEDLSGRRVTAVVNYLKDKGIAEGRLISTNNGSTETSDEITDEDDDDLKQAKNRRVTFRIR